jgi:hypothetical protein
MNRALVLASILAVSGVTFTLHAKVAASLAGISRVATEDTLIQKTQWPGFPPLPRAARLSLKSRSSIP